MRKPNKKTESAFLKYFTGQGLTHDEFIIIRKHWEQYQEWSRVRGTNKKLLIFTGRH